MKKGTAYFGNRFVSHAALDVLDIKKAGCDLILHTFSENDLRFNKEAMKEIVGISKAQNLEVYIGPWGVGKVFGGEAFSDFLTNHVEEMEEIENGEKRGIACLYSRKFREFMKGWIDAAVYIGADVIFFDEPHWYIAGWFQEKDHWGCRCERCRERFYSQFGYEMPKEMNGDVIQFKNDGILDFLRELSSYSKSKGIRNAVCLLPSYKEEDLILYRKIAQMDTVDILGTDPYWVWPGMEIDVSEYVSHFAKIIKELCNQYGKESEIWIQNFNIPAEKEEEILKALEIVGAYGIERVLTWGYKGSCGMSHLRCENPDKVWKAFAEF